MNNILIFILTIILICKVSQNAFAQSYPLEYRWIKVGSLHSFYFNWGSETEASRFNSAVQGGNQKDGLVWPAEYHYEYENRNNVCAKSFWIGTTNYTDPFFGNTTFPHKIVSIGPRPRQTFTIFPDKEKGIEMTGLFEAPLILVDDAVATENAARDLVDRVVADQIADRIITNITHSQMGITTTRKIYGWSHEQHKDYFIYEYVFKNTGIVDNNGTIHQAKLDSVIFHFQYRYAHADELFKATAYNRGVHFGSNNINWGKNSVWHNVGNDPTSWDNDDHFRATYAWYGRHSAVAIDDFGGADIVGNNGRLQGYQYIGFVTLHADNSAQDNSDNQFQPFTTAQCPSDNAPNNAINEFSATVMTNQYKNFMAVGHPDQTRAEVVGNAFADRVGSDPGGYSAAAGYGPYTLEFGDSVRIVIAEAAGGLGREMVETVGTKWWDQYNGNTNDPLSLPDGGTTNDALEYKEEWVKTGIDSLFRTFRFAQERFLEMENGADVQIGPLPPKLFQVKSGGDKILIEWDAEAENYPYFEGYKLFRGFQRQDSLFTEIFSCDNQSGLVYSFSDTTAFRGQDYYYYIQTYSTGEDNSISNKPLHSSRAYTVTNIPARLLQPASTDFLKDVRVVPNPYHIRARELQFGTLDGADRISFYGLPGICTIKIYTERGDLVNTLQHDDGSGVELWHSTTSSNQIIASGIYIVVIEAPNGKSTYRKFAVIR